MPGRSRGLPGASTARVRAFAQRWGAMSGETGNDLRRASSPHLTPTREHPQPDNQADALAVLTARAGRRITASDVGWDLHRPRNRHRHLDTLGDAPWRLCSTKSARETSWTAETCSRSPKAAATVPALTLLLGPIAAASAAPAATRLNEKLVRSIESAVRDLREMDDSTESASGDLTWVPGEGGPQGPVRSRAPGGLRRRSPRPEQPGGATASAPCRHSCSRRQETSSARSTRCRPWPGRGGYCPVISARSATRPGPERACCVIPPGTDCAPTSPPATSGDWSRLMSPGRDSCHQPG